MPPVNGNGDEYTPGQCFECRAGEHEDEDDDIKMVTVINPDTKKIYRHGKLCRAHRNIFLHDGYILEGIW
jgi:hypothetical protein